MSGLNRCCRAESLTRSNKLFVIIAGDSLGESVSNFPRAVERRGYYTFLFRG